MESVEVWIINLARSKDRWEKISQSLDSYKINYNRFDAIDGTCASVPKFNQAGYWLSTPGMRGCYLSHYTLWQQLQKSKNKYFLILEDDAIVHPKFMQILDKTINETPHFFYISLFNIAPPFFKKHGLNKISLSLTTTAYLLSKQGVETLCTIMPKEPVYHVDNVMNYQMLINRIPMLEIYPNPVTTDFTDSAILDYKKVTFNLWGLKVAVINPAQIVPIYTGDIIAYVLILISLQIPPLASIVSLITALIILVLTHS